MELKSVLVILVLSLLNVGNTQITAICPNGYVLRPPANEYCYRYFQIAEDFSAANRSCVRNGASLVFIDSSEENTYLHDTFFESSGQTEFWIGLNDMGTEGDFRWLNSNRSNIPSYLNWASGFPVDNTNSHDCVKFASDGWRVHFGFCSTSTLPHVCKMRSCSSLDGLNCIGSEPTMEPSVSLIAVVVPIVIVLLLIIIIVIVIILVGLWKFNNDAFQRYCCCCLFRGSKSAIHSMQQENQRLRHEISQRKISMSGRYQPGQLAGESELSGVPDGRGGMLPPIKRQYPGGQLSPTSEENKMLGFPATPLENAPPPLVAQRPSQVSPMRQTSQTSTSFFFGNPSSRPVRLSLPANIGIPARPSIPAPIRGGTVARSPKVISEEERKEENSESDSSESERES